MLGMTELAYRLLPLNMKLKARPRGLRRNLQPLHRSDGPSRRDTRRLPVSHGPAARCAGDAAWISPVATWQSGFFQEGLAWMSGGKNFLVEETACAACGDSACILRIVRQPLD